MRLYHKEELIKSALKYANSTFWEEILIKYAKDLECEEGDYYSCLFYLSTIKDSDYCGIGTNPKARYYLYNKEAKELYWFFLDSDAVSWANVENGYKPNYVPKNLNEKNYCTRNFFETYRGQYKNGFYWLLAKDILNLENILNKPPQIHCLDNGLTFADTITCATWLYNSGRSTSLHNAKIALEKHLAGQTLTCYKLKFEMR